MRVISFDTETWRIGPGAIAPRIVTITTAERVDRDVRRGIWGNGDADFEAAASRLLDLGHILVAHNAAYDLTVLTQNFPHLETKLWAKLDAGEITDTMIREMLLNLSTHGHINDLPMPDGSTVRVSYGLDSLVMNRFGEDISGDKDSPDSPRMNFHLMEGLRADQYPKNFRDYAAGDADWALRIYEAQEADVCTERGHASLSTAQFRTAAHYALQKMTIRGLATDGEYVDKIIKAVEAEMTDAKLRRLYRVGALRRATPHVPHKRQIPKALIALGEDPEDVNYDWGALTPEIREILTAEHGVKWKEPTKISKDLTALRRVIARVAKLHNITPKRSVKTEEISTDKEIITDLALYSRTLEAYKEWASHQKLLSTDLPKLFWDGKLAETVHAQFNPLLETGRTSSSATDLYPSFNGQQQGVAVRPAYKARPGFLICSNDYATLELATVAQVTYDLFGFSEHRNRINAGTDMHGFLAAQMASRYSRDFRPLIADIHDVDGRYGIFNEMKSSKDKADQKFHGKWRKFAKPVGLGFPGMLGPITFITFAKTTYDVNLLDVADEIGFQPEFDPRMWTYAKRLYGWNPDTDEFRWTRMLRAVALALELRDLWLDLYPEMREFFSWIKAQKDEHHEVVGYFDNGKPMSGLCYTSPLGMHRAACIATNAANGVAMQTPAAEGALAATMAVSRACYDEALAHPLLLRRAFPLLFIHDEIVSEVWAEDGLAPERADAIGEIMVQYMRLICPDVRISTEAVLTERWTKKGKMRRDANGRLQIWRPDEGETY